MSEDYSLVEATIRSILGEPSYQHNGQWVYGKITEGHWEAGIAAFHDGSYCWQAHPYERGEGSFDDLLTALAGPEFERFRK